MVRVLQERNAAAGISRRTSTKTVESNVTKKENPSKEANSWFGEAVKRSISEKQISNGTRKRTAFGDITNDVQSDLGRGPVRGKKSSLSKHPEAAAEERRRSNRVKFATSQCSEPALPMIIDHALESQSISSQCDEILKTPITSESSILPEGVDPFDQDEDPFQVCEYVQSIFSNMRKREAEYPIANYLTENGEAKSITAGMRAILIDWIIGVQHSFQLHHETLYVAVKLLDSYLQQHTDVPKEELQLVGTTALLLACKVEEYASPPLDDFAYICDDAYTKKDFLRMEMEMFKALRYDINIPIAYRYLRRFARVTSMGIKILTLARFILELSLQGAEFLHQPSSKMAAAALCLAMRMSEAGPWNANHRYHSGYEEHELYGVMEELNNMLIESPGSKLQTVRSKYIHPVKFAVAKTKPLPKNSFTA